MTTNRASQPHPMFDGCDLTIPALLRRAAECASGRPLVRFHDAVWTRAEALTIAAARAGSLAAAGVERGDRVALMLTNRSEFLETLLGAIWLGAVPVPLNVASRGFPLEHMLRNSGSRLLVIEDALLNALDTVDLEATSLAAIWSVGTNEPRSVGALRVVGFPARAASVPGATLDISSPAMILYTSGTTGLSKGVVCPQGQLYWYGANTGAIMALRDGEVLYTTLPLFHINALNSFMMALLFDATLVCDAGFSVSGYWSRVASTGANVLFLLGAMVPMLMSRPTSAMERDHAVRVVLAPGVPLPSKEAWSRRTGVPLLEAYASTESNVAIASPPGGGKPESMGVIVDGFEAVVADELDRPLPPGVPGELLLRAREPYAMALGYFRMPDQTVEAWRNQWLHTGDRVVRDEDGNFFFLDRLKDSIRRRGENISSFELEQVLLLHPAVANAAAFPVSSDLAEDEVMVAIVRREGCQLEPEALIRFCENKLPYFAIPRFVDFCEELPRTDTGKVQKFKLRERGRTSATWDREEAGVVVARA